MATALRKPDPTAPPPLKPAEASALSALALGTADEHQQKLAREWIIYRACRAFSDTFDPDPQTSTLLQGMRRAGLHIINAMNTSPKAAELLEQKDQ